MQVGFIAFVHYGIIINIMHLYTTQLYISNEKIFAHLLLNVLQWFLNSIIIFLMKYQTVIIK